MIKISNIKLIISVFITSLLVVNLSGCGSNSEDLGELNDSLDKLGPPVTSARAYFTKSGLTRDLNVSVKVASEDVNGELIREVAGKVAQVDIQNYATLDLTFWDEEEKTIKISSEQATQAGFDTEHVMSIGNIIVTKNEFEQISFTTAP